MGTWLPTEQLRELVMFSLEKKLGNGNTTTSFKYLGRHSGEKRECALHCSHLHPCYPICAAAAGSLGQISGASLTP